MKNRWFKFFPSDFLTGIRNLNPIEVTAYIIVLCELYDHEGSIRRDDEHMSRTCRIRKGDLTRAIDGLVAKGKLDISSGMLTNKRVSEEVLKRLLAADEKARLRHGGDMNATQPRHERGEKNNKNNGPRQFVRPYKEERIKKKSFFDEEQKPGLEGLLERQRQRSSRIQ
jgi:uncharacterized protein YdaU (DUF1376 family)